MLGLQNVGISFVKCRYSVCKVWALCSQSVGTSFAKYRHLRNGVYVLDWPFVASSTSYFEAFEGERSGINGRHKAIKEV